MTAGVITYEEVKQLSVSGKGTIIDVRNPEEVRGGKIPNSVNIPVAEFEKALKMDPETFRRTYNMDKPQLSDKNIVVHCQMGRRGASAAEIAAALGYIHVRNYAGAYQEWSMKEGK
ncbi:thiosulfate:glutathione sulfurtransferase [Rhinophrynus dorsalis]